MSYTHWDELLAKPAHRFVVAIAILHMPPGPLRKGSIKLHIVHILERWGEAQGAREVVGASECVGIHLDGDCEADGAPNCCVGTGTAYILLSRIDCAVEKHAIIPLA